MSDTDDSNETIINLLKKFMVMSEERARTLPYRVNLINTLGGACETKNSKILAAFLRYKSPGRYGRFEIMESLIKYIQFRFGAFSEIKIEKPSISIEHSHIDIYAREARKYAIIIENKSNWATDQNQQLHRYIETVKREDFSEDKIYVLYLPPLEEKDPEDQSWGEYKESFKDRYIKLSWRDDILPWMKNKVLPNIRKKDIPLSSALEQYIDYWEDQFGLRGVESEERMKMEMAVIEGLALKSEQDAEQALEVIRDAYLNAQELTETLRTLANKKKCEIELRFWDGLIAGLKSKGYDNIKPINLTEDGILMNYGEKNWYEVGFRIHFRAIERPFIFDCFASKDTGFFGFKFMDETGEDKQVNRPSKLNAQSQHIEQIVGKLLPASHQWDSWYGCVPTSEFDFRKMLWLEVIERLGTDEKCRACAQHWAERFDGYIKEFQKQLTDKNARDQLKESQP